jgi:hypothetical protein
MIFDFIGRLQEKEPLQQLSPMKSQLVQMSTDKSALETANGRLTADKASLETANGRLTADKASLEAANNQLTAANRQLEAANAGLARELAALRQQLQHLKEATAQARKGAEEGDGGNCRVATTTAKTRVETEVAGDRKKDGIGTRASHSTVDKAAAQGARNPGSNVDPSRKDTTTPVVDSTGSGTKLRCRIATVEERHPSTKQAKNLADFVEAEKNPRESADSQIIELLSDSDTVSSGDRRPASRAKDTVEAAMNKENEGSGPDEIVFMASKKRKLSSPAKSPSRYGTGTGIG